MEHKVEILTWKQVKRTREAMKAGLERHSGHDVHFVLPLCLVETVERLRDALIRLDTVDYGQPKEKAEKWVDEILAADALDDVLRK